MACLGLRLSEFDDLDLSEQARLVRKQPLSQVTETERGLVDKGTLKGAPPVAQQMECSAQSLVFASLLTSSLCLSQHVCRRGLAMRRSLGQEARTARRKRFPRS